MRAPQENARLEEMHMAKIRERIAYLEAQEEAAQEKRKRRNQLMRSDLNTQVFTACKDVDTWTTASM